MNLEQWMKMRDEAENALMGGTATPGFWKKTQEEAEQEIERILRA